MYRKADSIPLSEQSCTSKSTSELGFARQSLRYLRGQSSQHPKENIAASN